MKKTTLLLLLCGAMKAQANVTLPKAIDSKRCFSATCRNSQGDHCSAPRPNEQGT